jgi:hypothetical protein
MSDLSSSLLVEICPFLEEDEMSVWLNLVSKEFSARNGRLPSRVGDEGEMELGPIYFRLRPGD